MFLISWFFWHQHGRRWNHLLVKNLHLCCHKDRWKLSWHLIKNVQVCFHRYGWKISPSKYPVVSHLQMLKHSLCSRLTRPPADGKVRLYCDRDTCFRNVVISWHFLINSLLKNGVVSQHFFCPSKPVHNYSFSYTQTHTHLFIYLFIFFSSTGASLNDFWQTYPVVQRHLKINCPFPSISSWLLLNSNHISPPLSWAPLPKVGPVTHHKRGELDNVVPPWTQHTQRIERNTVLEQRNMVGFDSALWTLGECTWGEPVQRDHTNELLCIGGIGTNDGEDGIGSLKNWNIKTAAAQGRFIIFFHSWCTEFQDIVP